VHFSMLAGPSKQTRVGGGGASSRSLSSNYNRDALSAESQPKTL
jgi:hypothetical protein